MTFMPVPVTFVLHEILLTHRGVRYTVKTFVRLSYQDLLMILRDFASDGP
jgi:hypothetical protein